MLFRRVFDLGFMSPEPRDALSYISDRLIARLGLGKAIVSTAISSIMSATLLLSKSGVNIVELERVFQNVMKEYLHYGQ